MTLPDSIKLYGDTLYTVRVIHSVPLKMSVIQVFYKDKMAVVSQLIGPEQLPAPEQVRPVVERQNGKRGLESGFGSAGYANGI